MLRLWRTVATLSERRSSRASGGRRPPLHCTLCFVRRSETAATGARREIRERICRQDTASLPSVLPTRRERGSPAHNSIFVNRTPYYGACDQKILSANMEAICPHDVAHKTICLLEISPIPTNSTCHHRWRRRDKND